MVTFAGLQKTMHDMHRYVDDQLEAEARRRARRRIGIQAGDRVTDVFDRLRAEDIDAFNEVLREERSALGLI